MMPTSERQITKGKCEILSFRGGHSGDSRDLCNLTACNNLPWLVMLAVDFFIPLVLPDYKTSHPTRQSHSLNAISYSQTVFNKECRSLNIYGPMNSFWRFYPD